MLCTCNNDSSAFSSFLKLLCNVRLCNYVDISVSSFCLFALNWWRKRFYGFLEETLAVNLTVLQLEPQEAKKDCFTYLPFQEGRNLRTQIT